MEKHDFLSQWASVTGKQPKGSGGQYKGICPAHDDQNASLSVRFDSDKILLHCHAGCDTQAIVDAMGMSLSDLYVEDKPAKTPPVSHEKPVIYRYTDEAGNLIAEKVRNPGKNFSWRVPDGNGKYSYSTKGLTIPLYNIQCLKSPEHSGYVYLVEGEKDVDTLKPYVSVVSGANGCGQWCEHYSDELAGQVVYIIPDNDKPGREYAKKAYKSLKNKAKAVYLVDLRKLWPEIPDKGDLSDFFAHDKDALVKLNEYRENAPLFAESLLDGVEVVTVGESVQQEGDPVIELLTADKIEEKETEFLIKPYIPRYQLTIIGAPGGTGKTTLVCSIIAAVTTGEKSIFDEGLDFYEKRAPVNVMYLSGEDDFAHVLNRRMRKQGADLSKVYTLDASNAQFSEVKLKSEQLDKMLERYRPGLLILDPLQSFIPTRVEMSKRNEMRDCLQTILYYGEKYGVTTIIVAHTNKQSNVWGRNRLADSSDLWDASRSVLMLDKTGEGAGRYISHEKSNYAVLGDTILFDIEDGAIVYTGRTDKKDEDFVRGKNQARVSNEPAKDNARAEILEYLKQNGKVATKELDDYLKAVGISRNTASRAKKELKEDGLIKYNREGNGQAKGTTHSIELTPYYTQKAWVNGG